MADRQGEEEIQRRCIVWAWAVTSTHLLRTVAGERERQEGNLGSGLWVKMRGRFHGRRRRPPGLDPNYHAKYRSEP